jgi:CRISPR-associated endonuclease/helicase Cas3
MHYTDFFLIATALPPFHFQERVGSSEASTTVLKAPTGLGKTDSVLVSWLHRRVTEPATTPRRLVWCLPGRALTEQVAQVAEERIHRLVTAGLMQPIKVYRLMGGSEDNDAKLRPDQEAILVGTQDILLSRALNRGYARTPFRWPIDFALLNNDCLWVMDEVQLLGDGLATSTQLAAFREKFGVFGAAQSCWISATVDPAWMETVDFAAGPASVIELDDDDLKNDIVKMRWNAAKMVERAPVSCRLPEGVAEFVAARHAAGTLTLVIANTVRRAVEIRVALEKKTTADVRLLHSRFRAADRKRHVEAALGTVPEAGRIVVATQVIEAGIDIDATLMVSDLAPYASMVQRFGRVNRKGERSGCRIYWVDRPLADKQRALADEGEISKKEQEQVCLPYDAAEVAVAAGMLAGMTSAAPADLPPLAASPAPWKHVLRRADLLDLFDTSADLGGNEIDISRFVRSDPERDVYVFWRDWAGKDKAPPEKMAEVDDGELCPAPTWEVSARTAWAWNAAEGEWARPETIYAGMTLLMHVSEGKYTADYGWRPGSKVAVEPLVASGPEMEKNDDDRKTYVKYRQTLRAHTEQVCEEMQRLVEALPGMGLDPHHGALTAAARFHDWGKAHPVMQETLQGVTPLARELLAKSTGNGRHSRRFFRHELASALAMIGAGESDLAAYVVAAHHGRIRVVVRSMQGERIAGSGRVRGLEDGETLLKCSLGAGVEREETAISLKSAMLGSMPGGVGSWTELVLRLRDELGPFRVAYLEMLLRVADETASAKAAEGAAV